MSTESGSLEILLTAEDMYYYFVVITNVDGAIAQAEEKI